MFIWYGMIQVLKVFLYLRCKDSQVYSNDVIIGIYEVLNVLFVGEINDVLVRFWKVQNNRVQMIGFVIKFMYFFC